MAFAYTGGAINGASSTTATTGVHSIDIFSGDLVVLYISSNSDSGSIAVNSDTGAAWTTVFTEVPTTSAAETCEHGLFWKIANGSEPTSYTVSTANVEYRIILKVFTSATDAEVSGTYNTHGQTTNSKKLICGAWDGQTVPDDGLSIICGGKDRRGSLESYDKVDTGHVSPIGNVQWQMTAMAHKIYVGTGETGSGDITIETTDGSDTGTADKTFSAHIAFVESSAGGSIIPQVMHHRGQMQ